MRLIPRAMALATCVITAVPLAASAATVSGATAATDAPDLSDRQWDMVDIGAAEANDLATGAGATVAVVDTGIDIEHPEFTGRIVNPVSWICPSGVAVPCEGLEYVDDGHGHGTHVAGTVAAADDGAGITGVAPDAKIMPVRVGDDGGSISGDLAGGIRYATAHGADVITMSIGYIAGLGPVVTNPVIPLDDLADAIQEAHDAGIVVTLSAGNDAVPYCGQGSQFWGDTALCVAAYGTDDDPAIYTDWGWEIDIAAPGGGLLFCDTSILSTVPLDDEIGACSDTTGYDIKSGTSMATPHVAGVAALLAEQCITGADARQRILGTARVEFVELSTTVTGLRLDAAAAVADGSTCTTDGGGNGEDGDSKPGKGNGRGKGGGKK